MILLPIHWVTLGPSQESLGTPASRMGPSQENWWADSIRNDWQVESRTPIPIPHFIGTNRCPERHSDLTGVTQPMNDRVGLQTAQLQAPTLGSGFRDCWDGNPKSISPPVEALSQAMASLVSTGLAHLLGRMNSPSLWLSQAQRRDRAKPR